VLISVILNNFDYGGYITAAVDSALGQTYGAVEVIVVDDGSTDNSRELLRAYGSRITLVLKANGGQASALNAGLAHSHGDIVIFLDADDVLMPTTAAQVAAAFRAHPGAARAHYRMAVIDAQGALTGAVKPAGHLPLLSGDLRRHVLNFPDDLPWLPTSGNAYAASVLRQIMPMPEAPFRILADYYLSHVTPLFGHVIALDTVGAHYRVHGSNSYARDGAPLDLAHVRRTIEHWQAAHVYLQRFADQLGLPGRPSTAAGVLSVALIANRLVSLKLEAARHPVPGDTPGRLLRLGWRAAARRFDVSPVMKLLFMAWFLVMALAPKAWARPVAELFLLPERRRSLNGWLGGLHRRAPAHSQGR
jgi:hypothetical protein